MKLAASNEVMMVRVLSSHGLLWTPRCEIAYRAFALAFIPLSLLAKQDAKFGRSNAHVTLLNDPLLQDYEGTDNTRRNHRREGEEA